ncbi:hypothetical protein LguiA_027105 [Lonicera macranthoides]
MTTTAFVTIDSSDSLSILKLGHPTRTLSPLEKTFTSHIDSQAVNFTNCRHNHTSSFGFDLNYVVEDQLNFCLLEKHPLSNIGLLVISSYIFEFFVNGSSSKPPSFLYDL